MASEKAIEECQSEQQQIRDCSPAQHCGSNFCSSTNPHPPLPRRVPKIFTNAQGFEQSSFVQSRLRDYKRAMSRQCSASRALVFGPPQRVSPSLRDQELPQHVKRKSAWPPAELPVSQNRHCRPSQSERHRDRFPVMLALSSIHREPPGQLQFRLALHGSIR